jgi:hypothetical protein
MINNRCGVKLSYGLNMEQSAGELAYKQLI